MADWNSPSLTDPYADFLDSVKGRDFDAGSLFLNVPTNPIVGMIRFNRSTNIFEEYRTSPSPDWYALVIGPAGGGTGGSSPVKSMAYQESNAVDITGGSIKTLTTFELGCDITADNNETRSIGTLAKKIKNLYVGKGLIIPVGADRWISS